MDAPKLMGQDWLDAQRVDYQLIPVASMEPAAACAQLGILPQQFVVCELFLGKKEPVLAVHGFGVKVDLNALALHVGDGGFRPATKEEIRLYTHQEPGNVHPLIEGYLWKVLDERLFENEKIYLPIGGKNTLLCMDATALKYSVGVINGLIAAIAAK